MKLVRPTLILGALAVVLSACGGAESAPANPASESGSLAEAATPGESPTEPERTGSGFGTITSLGTKGDFVTIDHGPIEGLMGSMTMGFELVSDVDIAGLAEGDTVAFSVKHGRDGVYRIISICKTTESGSDCLVEEAVK
ncbi:copper-binding protein [Hyphomonas sp.]|uniref:copper-binding protein n=1 Tax=Hyphomonas sp. TaxID=87 RepID=UPI0025C19317|nr:copper-binding protein [Hyphomonas sp.]